MGKAGGIYGQDGQSMRYTGCRKSDINFMHDHAIYNGHTKTNMCYEGHIGINGEYKKILIGTDGKKFDTIGGYDLTGEIGITLGKVRDTNWDKGAETRFNVSVFGGTKCGAKVDLTGKTAVGGNANTRFCLKGDMYGEYAHSLSKGKFIESMPAGLEQYQPKLSTVTAGANVGFQIDATAQRLQINAMAGPEFQYNRATFGDQTYEYKNGVITANLGVEYTAHMPKDSKVGIIIGADAGMEIPAYISKDGQGSIKVSGITDSSNITPKFALKTKIVF